MTSLISHGLLLSLSLALLLTAVVEVNGAVQLSAAASSWLVAGRTATIHVALTGLPAQEPVSVKANLYSSTSDDADAVAGAIILYTTSGSNGESLTFDLPASLSEGAHTLVVSATSIGNIELASVKSTVAVSAQSKVVFVETDKSLYLPSQTVNIVALAVDYDLLPVASMPITVELISPSKFKIRRWASVLSDEFGFVQLANTLPSEPELGSYFLNVLHPTSLTVLSSTQFNVSNYVLPRFQTSASCSPAKILPSTTSVKCSVFANYTVGQSVAGVANITVLPIAQQRQGWFNDIMPMAIPFASSSSASSDTTPIYQQVITLINGATSFTFNLAPSKTDGGSSPFISQSRSDLQVSVQVIEDATKHSEFGSTTLAVAQSSIDLILIGQDSTFKPGMPFKMLVVSRDPNGAPIDTPFSLFVAIDGNAGLKPSITGTTKDGLAEISVGVPAGTERLNIFSSDSPYTYASFNAAFSPSASFLAMDLNGLDGLGQVGASIEVGASAVFDLRLLLSKSIAAVAAEQLTVQFIATCRGDIVASGSVLLDVKVSSTASSTALYSGKLSLDITTAMSPQVKIVAWCVAAGSGEVIADYAVLSVAASTSLAVLATFNATQVLPGAPVEVRLATSSPARVLLTALDQSVVLMGGASGRLQLDQVLTLLAAQPSALASVLEAATPCLNGRMAAADIFAAADVKFLTNSVVPTRPASPWGCGGVDAGAVAELAPTFAPSGAATSSAPIARLRSYFPESWFSTLVDTSAVGPGLSTGVFTTTAPDTITSWDLHAIAMSPTQGIGFASAPTLTVFQPFFVDAQLPASAVRGEVLPVVVPVFNYFGHSATVKLTLISASDFNITDRFGSPASGIVSISGRLTFVEATLVVEAGGVSSFTFYIRPIALGVDAVTIIISAESVAYSDKIARKLSVRAEGFAQSYVINNFVDMADTTQPSSESGVRSFGLTPSVPESSIAGSTRLRFTVTADLMADTINNIDRLVSQPTGCGEQNLITLAPMIYVMQYVQGTSLLTSELSNKLTTFMASGYARELTYQHSDASFSAFGQSDPEGSMWLSAFVLKVFAQARPFVFIDAAVLVQVSKYLVSNQNTDGSFKIRGTVVHGEGLFGGSGDHGPVAFTAYVTIALLESGLETEAVAKATSYLEANIGKLSDSVYSMSLVAFALTKAGSTSAGLASLLSVLNLRAVVDADGLHLPTNMDASVRTADASSQRFCYSCSSSSLDVEATSYYLLTMLARNEMTSALPLSKYLLAKKNGAGGFFSTQDTVLGIEALAQYGKIVRSSSVSLLVQIVASNSLVPITSFSLDASNFDLLQSIDLNDFVGVPLTVYVAGTGKAVTQFAVSYHSPTDVSAAVEPAFTLAVGYNDASLEDTSTMIVTPCISLSAATANGGAFFDPGMTVVEIGLFTGYQVDTDSLARLVATGDSSGGVRRFEYDAQANKVVFYFDNIVKMPRLHSSPLAASADTGAHICMQFSAYRAAVVTQAQAATSSIYAYYSPSQRDSFALARNRVAAAPAPNLDDTNQPPRSTTSAASTRFIHFTPFFALCALAAAASALATAW